MFDWYGPIAFLVTFASVIVGVYFYLNWKINHQPKWKKKKKP